MRTPFTTTLADVSILHRTVQVTLPDTCPSCRAPLHGENGVDVSELNWLLCSVDSAVTEEGLEPGGYTDYGDCYVPVGLECAGCHAALVMASSAEAHDDAGTAQGSQERAIAAAVRMSRAREAGESWPTPEDAEAMASFLLRFAAEDEAAHQR
jgi:hypothetical protein